MRNLILFIRRNLTAFLFVGLQGVAITLTIRHSQYHQAVLWGVFDEISGYLMSVYHQANSYFRLARFNKELAADNARLRALLPSSTLVDTGQAYLHHNLHTKQFYSYIPAQVIQVQTTQANNYLMLNRGSKHGVRPHMGVISPEGVVGIVRSVSPHFATVSTLLHSQTLISARVGLSGSRGTVRWDGLSPWYVKLDEIPFQEAIQAGDTIYTSGYSHIFPDKIPIGTIASFRVKETGDFFDIKVRLAVPYHKLDHVWIVVNLFKTEMDSLLNRTNYDR